MNKSDFEKVVSDFRKCLATFEMNGIKLAGPNGTGEPQVNQSAICFNGSRNCGHAKNFKLVIAWPADEAGGVASKSKEAIAGKWLGGAMLEKRICDGDCSYETFHIDQIFNVKNWPLAPDDEGWYSYFCKTNFKPYDLAVTTCLVILKHHLLDEIQVGSDGEEAPWWDAKFLCQSQLGYGLDFQLDT